MRDYRAQNQRLARQARQLAELHKNAHTQRHDKGRERLYKAGLVATVRLNPYEAKQAFNALFERIK